MPRNLSVAKTIDQVRNRQKTVTRRLGWKTLKPGQILNTVTKSMGLKPGQKINRINQVVVTRVTREPLSHVTDADVAREGFPEMNREQFIEMFKQSYKVNEDDIITRVEFDYL